MTTEKQFYTKGTASELFVDYSNMPKVVQPGNLIYIDDGLISLRVKQIGKYLVIDFVSLLICLSINLSVS